VVEQYTENQYDDDLTVEAGEYDEYYPTDAVDLLEFTPQEESPLSRLKSLILSIDWEITDEILIQFNDELLALKDLWAAEKFNLVYIQALEKISKYIYQQKANAHPDAIKLLLTFYYNLEQIVYSDDLTEHQKKDILLKDVSRFQYLKRQIANQGQDDHMFHDEEKSPKTADGRADGNELLKLKAIVLGIDWEITDQDLNGLRQEVIRLEGKYSESRPRLILLQGIGILGAYIKSKKGDAHADAFTLLHYFFECLEKMSKSPLSLEEEKKILFPAVEKFNSFKVLVGSTITADAAGAGENHGDDTGSSASGVEIQPAFADIPEDSVAGFQEDEEAKDLGDEESVKVADHIDSFFGEDEAGAVQLTDEVGGATTPAESGEAGMVDSELALEGTDISYNDEIEKGISDKARFDPPDTESLTVDSSVTADIEPEIELTEPFDQDSGIAFSIDKDLALQGVDVETEADDDSDEEALPIAESGRLAPALDGSGEPSEYGSDSFVEPQSEDALSEEIAATLDQFFVDDQLVEAAIPAEEPVAVEEHAAEAGRELEAEVGAVEEKISADEEVVFELVDSDSASDDVVDISDEIVTVEKQEADIEEMAEEIDTIDVEEIEPVEVLEESTAAEEPEENLEEIVEVDEQDLEPAAIAEGDITEIAEDGVTVIEPEADLVEIQDEAAAEELEEDLAEAPEDVVAVEELEDDIAEVPEEAIAVLVPEEGLADDSVAALGAYIDDIGLEVDDRSIQGLSCEIEKLHNLWGAKPLEKSFLRLLSTVTQHLDQYGYDANPESYGLLKSGHNALQSLTDDTEQNQEVLFREMSRVLQWQQDMLIVGEFPVESVDNESDVAAEEEMAEGLSEESSYVDGISSAVDLKKEIAGLRETLQTEIASLKKELRREISSD
jgi:pilus assembly protein FimV